MKGKRKYPVAGICCSTEEQMLRKKLDADVGAQHYTFSASTCELVVDSSVDEDLLLRSVREAGFSARNREEPAGEQPFLRRHAHAVNTGTAAVLALAGILLEQLQGTGVLSAGLLLAAILAGGWRVFLRAGRAVRSLSLDMNFLMAAAVLGALIIDRWAEAAAVIVLFDLSLALETYSTTRTRRAIALLMKLSPEQACLETDGRETIVPAREVLPGQLLVIRPGERIPLDGVVVEGTSSVNESALTGESAPVEKAPGHQILAGTLNDRGSLRVRVTRRAEETTIARMMHLVEEAHHTRAPVQQLVDRFARVYTPAVFGIAAVVAILPPLLFADPFAVWFYRALVLLVIACPCALVISTPVSIVSALTSAARRGILIKGGRHIETLQAVRAMAFDKTGTLTHGRPRITDILPLNSLSPDEVVRIVAAMEHRSEHHLAGAVLEEAARRSVVYDDLPVKDFRALPGRGIEARVAGETYFLGNHQLCEEREVCSEEVEDVLDRLARQGKTPIVLGRKEGALAILGIQDTLRAHGKHALERLHALGIHHTVMLSGDSATIAEPLARDLGIREVRAGLMPEEKLRAVRDLKETYGSVAMVGDGINDAPALAASSVGIAMGGSGTDAALETADVVLMSDDLSRLPQLVRLSRRTVRIIRQNILFALTVKLAFLVLSIAGVATLWMAVLADDGATLLVIMNGLRLLSNPEGS